MEKYGQLGNFQRLHVDRHSDSHLNIFVLMILFCSIFTRFIRRFRLFFFLSRLGTKYT